ncbi:MAG: esterase family protein [Anaerolineae bacterium]|nr:esterase family protein [Anaerolineae bacterium]
MLLLLLTTVSPTLSQDASSAVNQEDFFSTTLNRTYQYQLYLPAGYETSDQAYPVIYLLHGRGDTMEGWLNARDTLDELVETGEVPPLIAVMPDMPSNERAGYYIDSQYSRAFDRVEAEETLITQWLAGDFLYRGSPYRGEAVETAFMDDLIPHIESTYRALTNREGRLLGGYSMGGYGALRYAMAYPERFGGAIVLSPAVYTPLPPADSSTREFGAFGKGDSLFDDEIYQSLNYPALVDSLEKSGLPLHVFIAVGDDEWKNPNPEDRLHDLDMEAHLVYNVVARIPNVTSEFRVYDGGHDWDVWRPGFSEGLRYLARFMDSGS